MGGGERVIRWFVPGACLVLCLGGLFWSGVYDAVGPSDGLALNDPQGLKVSSPSVDALGWIVAGGGAAPSSNQCSLERDLALAAEAFQGPGRLLFAGGPGTDGVQVRDAIPRGDPLRAALGEGDVRDLVKERVKLEALRIIISMPP